MKPIYVTQPTLPPLEEFIPYLEQIWENKILTNGGEFHQQLEQALCDYLGVKHLALNVARGLEKGLKMMWQRFCSGLPVESFSVPKKVD